MNLEKIIAISGKPGLYELLSQTRSGFLVRSLIDDKKKSVSVRNNVSVLAEIAIYTYETEVPLKDVFSNIAEKYNHEAILSHKSHEKELVSFFSEILPNYDKQRVYLSDIKKVVQWYNLLEKSNLLKTEETAEK